MTTGDCLFSKEKKGRSEWMEGSRKGRQYILHNDETLDKVNASNARQLPKAPQAFSGYFSLAVMKKK